MEKRKSHPVRRGRFLKIADCFLAFFLTASAAGLWFSAHPSSALARELQKVMQYLGGGSYSTDPDSTGVMEKNRTKRITDLSNLESVLPLMPQLFVPEYIPEGWEMESLEITDHVNETVRAEFIFVNHENARIYIDEAYGRDMESGFWNVDESIVLSNRTVSVHKDSNTKENTAVFFEDNVLVQITGLLGMEELLQIADQMKNRE